MNLYYIIILTKISLQINKKINRVHYKPRFLCFKRLQMRLKLFMNHIKNVDYRRRRK